MVGHTGGRLNTRGRNDGMQTGATIDYVQNFNRRFFEFILEKIQSTPLKRLSAIFTIRGTFRTQPFRNTLGT